MGGSRRSTAKKLPYKVLGKKLVDAYYVPPGGVEGFSTVAVRSHWPKDDPMFEASIRSMEREAQEWRASEEERQRQQQQQPPQRDPHKLK